MRYVLLFCLIGMLVNCTDEPESPYYELSGTTQARITRLGEMLSLPANQKSSLTDSILDAQMFQQTLGSGGGLGLGPTDYCHYYAITVTPQSINHWVTILKPIAEQESWNHQYSAPAQTKAWWVSELTFKTLTLYDAFSLTNEHGWIGLDKTGHIYIAACSS